MSVAAPEIRPGVVLAARELSRMYMSGEGAVWALRDVTFDLPEGAFLAVTGPSGCGKTTLLSLLGGLERPTGGQVYVGGRNLATLPERDLVQARRKSLGFVFQGFYLLEHLTALENVALPGRFAGLSAAQQRERALHLLEEVGLADRAHHYPRQLSGGQQQRVAIARALMNEPSVILADEPTGNLDDAATGAILDIFRRLNEAGQTFVVVTHDPQVAEFAHDRVRLENGVIHESSLDNA